MFANDQIITYVATLMYNFLLDNGATPVCSPETYSDPIRTSKMEFFLKLAIFAKGSVSNVRLGFQ